MVSSDSYVHCLQWPLEQSTLLHKRRKEEPFDEPCSTEPRSHPLLQIGLAYRIRRRDGMYRTPLEAERYDAYYYLDWTDSPFMALQECPRCADDRMRACPDLPGRTKIVTVVNPNVALHKKGDHHLLNLRNQSLHYGLKDVAEGHPEELGGWYAYIDRISKEHIVGHWAWKELKDNERWYEEIVLPAFKEHDRKFWAEKNKPEKDEPEDDTPEIGLRIIRPVPVTVPCVVEKESESDEDSITLAKKGLQKEERKRKTLCGMTASLMRGIAHTHLSSRKTKESKGKQRGDGKTKEMSEKKGL